MSRARNIKPGFFTNGELLECQPLARILFAGLWCEADRRGILEDRPKTIKVKILPGDNCDVNELLDELTMRGFILRYESCGIRCISIPKFSEHQHPHIKEQASTLPEPGGHDTCPVRTPDESGPETMQASVKHGASTVQTPDSNGINPAESLLPITESLLLNTRSHERESVRAINSDPKPKPKRSKSTLVDLPDDFEVTDPMRRWAHEKKKLNDAEIDHRTEHFLNYVEKTGKQYASWPAAWRDSMDWIPKVEPQFVNGGSINGHVPRRTGGAAAGGMTPQELDAYAAELERQGL